MITVTGKGTENYTRNGLYGIPVPRSLARWGDNRPAGAFWEPVQHGRLARIAVESVEDVGLDIVDEKWIVCRQGMGLIGDLEVIPNLSSNWEDGPRIYNMLIASELSMHVVLRHSNDARWSLEFLAGVMVFVCANGMMSTRFGERTKRKHSKNIDLLEYVDHSVHQVCDGFAGLLRDKEYLEEIELSGSEGDYLAVEAARRNIIPWSYIKPVTTEWRQPTYKEFRARNAWSLYNAFTLAAKKRSSSDQVDTIANACQLLLEFGRKSGRLLSIV